VFLTGSAQYAIRSAGAYDYQFANDWTGPVGRACISARPQATLALQAVVSGESKARTRRKAWRWTTRPRVVYLGPQINFTWGSRFSAQVGADLPVSIESTGNQLVPDYRVRAAVTFWRF